MRMISRGAEADIYFAEFFGRTVVIKKRVRKDYRHPELDHSIRKTRTRKEARLMIEARKAGVRVPIIYDVYPEEYTITMEYIPGQNMKQLCDNARMGREMLSAIGRSIGKLHAAGIVHGDLTLSNMLWYNNSLYLIDFSLGSIWRDVEELGVDLHLLQESLRAVHPEPEKSFYHIFDVYRDMYPQWRMVEKKVAEIQRRGRYI